MDDVEGSQHCLRYRMDLDAINIFTSTIDRQTYLTDSGRDFQEGSERTAPLTQALQDA